jgi:hypothetical protein
MKFVLTGIAILPLLVGVAHATDEASSHATDEAEWQSLFDGKTLSGWHLVNGSADFAVIGGAIVGTTKVGSPNSFLATEQTFEDFVLEFEVKQTVGPTNSGVQFRSHSKPEVMAGRVHGPQLDLDPSERQWTGGLYDEAGSGWWYPGSLHPQPGLYRFNEWNRIRIEAIGPSMRTWVNGEMTAHVIDASYRDGFIALQVHSIQSPEEAGRRIHWRNLRIKRHPTAAPLQSNLFVRNTLPNDLSEVERQQGWQLLWDGSSTSGWRSNKGDEFPTRGWRIRNGELVVTGAGGGDIVTEQTFGAFELQLEFQLTPGANSGIFYYVGDHGSGNLLGLEYQLLDDERHPDARQGQHGNRTLASLYDIQPLSRLMTNIGIAPEVGKWQHARIVATADGNIEHWLNGVKVVSFNRHSAQFRARVAASKYKDVKNYGELERGHILLQDHGDEVRFRSIKIRPL